MLTGSKTAQGVLVAALVVVILVLAAWTTWRDSIDDSSSVAGVMAGDHEGSITFEARERTYLLHIPPTYDGITPHALVIVLHGGGGNPHNIASVSGFSDEADRQGFIVVYPEGTGRFRDGLLTWNAETCCGYALDNEVNDVGFVDALISKLGRELKIDTRRIFATGISNGGMMAYLLACRLSNRIAAIGPVAGALNIEDCNPSEPVSVIIFHGTADRHVLYEGGVPLVRFDPHPRVDKPVSYAVSFWVKKNHCSLIPQTTENANIAVDVYSGCSEGTEVVLYTIKGGTHSWPGGLRGSAIGDEPSKEISATEIMWQFFSQHSKQLAPPFFTAQGFRDLSTFWTRDQPVSD